MKKLIYFIIFLVFSCDSYQDSPFPYVPVDIRINLNDLRHQNLRQNGGFLYFQGGLRGVIVYRKNASTYYAFERTCTFEPNQECAQVSVDNSGFFMMDTCCSSQFDFEGNVMSGVATFPLQRYQTTLIGNELQIRN